jgi:hypothetical protein
MGMKEDRPMINRGICRKDLEVVLSTGPCGGQIRIHDSISTPRVARKSENMHFARLVTDVFPQLLEHFKSSHICSQRTPPSNTHIHMIAVLFTNIPRHLIQVTVWPFGHARNACRQSE